MTISDKMDIINDINRQIILTEQVLVNLKKMRNEAIELHKSKCKHLEYMCEHNGDMHQSGYYYNCMNCSYYTDTKPATGKITYR